MFLAKIGTYLQSKWTYVEFEVSGDQNNFIDLQKIFLKVKCKIVQWIWNPMQELLLTKRKLMLHTFATMCYIHFFLIVRYRPEKFQMLTETMRTKVLARPNFLKTKTQKTHG